MTASDVAAYCIPAGPLKLCAAQGFPVPRRTDLSSQELDPCMNKNGSCSPW